MDFGLQYPNISVNLHPPTPGSTTVQTSDAPCPTSEERLVTELEQGAQSEPSNPSPEPRLNDSGTSTASPDSHETSPSKLTSSNKLSALPLHTSLNIDRNRRPANFGFVNKKRGYRRSLDASTSLPSFSANNFDTTPLNHAVWEATQVSGIPLQANGLPFLHSSASDGGSDGKETSKQRVSFDSDRGSPLSMRSVGQAFSRLARGNDSVNSSPALRSSTIGSQRDVDSPDNPNVNSRSPSHSRSRAASPLRIFQQWSSGLRNHHASAEERFVPINPFKRKTHIHLSWCCGSPSRPQEEDVEHNGESFNSSDGLYQCDDLIDVNSIKSFFSAAHVFLNDTLPRQLYLNFLLRLPAMYFSRVARIFQDAEVSRPDIQRMIDSNVMQEPLGVPFNNNPVSEHVPNAGSGVYPPAGAFGHGHGAVSAIGLSAHVGAAPAYSQVNLPLPLPEDWTPSLVSPSLIRFKLSWEAFIDSLLREWKTLNVVSALLASAILTIFQIPEAADDPITRTAALLSLICALMSLSYGCMYIVRFGSMRSMYRASRWAEEARKTNTLIWWNVWVLLAMPAVWMSWSMLLFLASILSFVWRTGSENDPAARAALSATAILGPRIGITFVLLLGLIYLAMIVKTLMRYGSPHGSRGGSTQGILRPGMGVTGTSVAAVQGSTTTEGRDKAVEVDVVMDSRRGRERRRSATRRVRRRQEGVDRVDHVEAKDEQMKEKSTLGTVLGFGMSGVMPQLGDQDSGIGMELDKVDS